MYGASTQPWRLPIMPHAMRGTGSVAQSPSNVDNAAANAMIKRHNPEMTDDLLAYSVAKMREHGVVDSGDTLTLGIGAMTDARMKSFYDKMVRAKVVDPSVDRAKAYTLQFVNKKVGLELRPKR